MKLAIAGFIVPYIFVYNNALLMIDTTFFEGAVVTLTSITGVIMLGISVERHYFVPLSWPLRIVMFLGSIMLITPNMLQDLAGLVILIIITILQWMKMKKNHHELTAAS